MKLDENRRRRRTGPGLPQHNGRSPQIERERCETRGERAVRRDGRLASQMGSCPPRPLSLSTLTAPPAITLVASGRAHRSLLMRRVLSLALPARRLPSLSRVRHRLHLLLRFRAPTLRHQPAPSAPAQSAPIRQYRPYYYRVLLLLEAPNQPRATKLEIDEDILSSSRRLNQELSNIRKRCNRCVS